MLKYNHQGVNIQESEDGFNMAFDRVWCDLPFEDQKAFIVNNKVTGIYIHDGAVYMAVESTLNGEKHRIVKISTDGKNGASVVTMGLPRDQLIEVMNALSNTEYAHRQ